MLTYSVTSVPKNPLCPNGVKKWYAEVIDVETGEIVWLSYDWTRKKYAVDDAHRRLAKLAVERG